MITSCGWTGALICTRKFLNLTFVIVFIKSMKLLFSFVPCYTVVVHKIWSIPISIAVKLSETLYCSLFNCRRNIFNWTHRIVGTLALIFGGTSVL